MYNINKNNDIDLSWFAKRFNALIVDFPKDINTELLANDEICSKFDKDEVFDALKFAYAFLTGIACELFKIQKEEKDTEKWAYVEYVFSKIDLIWALCLLGELKMENNEYYLCFEKSNLRKEKTLPDNYTVSFKNISDNGCYAEYFKREEKAKDYKSCERGTLYFDDRLTVLGLYLFVKKTAQKRWYWEEDKAGGYSHFAFDPIIHCVAPYYRIDMRVFTCEDRLDYDILENMAGYSNELKGYVKEICNFVKDNYPACLPKGGRGVGGYIWCVIPFLVDRQHRMLAQFGIGNENFIDFFSCISGKEMIPFLEHLDEYNPNVIGNNLLDINHDRSQLKHSQEIIYRGEKYLFGDVTGEEFRFIITCPSNVEQAIKIIDIKGKCKKHTL